MPIVTVVPDFAVNTDNVESIHYVEGTDDYKEKHVIINFKEFGHELAPGYTVSEITAAMDGGCYYRTQYDEMVGEIDICVLHGSNSKYSPQVNGPYRHCLTRDPYVEWAGPLWGIKTIHKPAVENSWEYQEKKHREEAEAFKKKLEEEKLSPVAEWMSSDHALILPEYDEPKKRTLWDRLIGR